MPTAGSSRSDAPVTPLSLPKQAGGVVLFGGSFDPPHRWHTLIASAARRKLFPRDGWIVLVPAARSPFKASGPVASDEHRIRMLRLATRNLRRCLIWTDEIDRARWRLDRDPSQQAPSYTIDTVRRLRSQLKPTFPVRLLIGSDQAVQFHRWRDHTQLLQLAEPVVVMRPPVDTPREFAAHLAQARAQASKSPAWKPQEIEQWLARVIQAPTNPMSATAVRELLAHAESSRQAARARLAAALNPAVARYIARHGLYHHEADRLPRHASE